MPKQKRRDYRAGAVYQRCEARYGCPPLVDGKRPEHKCAARWYGVIEAGWNANNTRRRITVSAKTEAEAKKRLARKRTAQQVGQQGQSRATVKSYAAEYLKVRVTELRPKAYNAAANPIMKWVIPTIGHKRLDLLAPDDVRSVGAACRKAKRSPNDVHRAMMTMLRSAARDGHAIPQGTLLVKPPAAAKSDRTSMTVPEGLDVLKVAAGLPHGSRWLFTMLYGARLGECLGLTWDAIDFDAGAYGEAVIEWQLQALPYNVRRDRSSGFRVPDGYEAKRLVDAYHLVRPKSGSGFRVAPLLEPVSKALKAWRKVAPKSEHGLVWPTTTGRPANEANDREEWWALQGTAGVGHPAGRPYHVHECRNFAATMLLEAGVDEHVVTALLGHSSVVMSRKYMTVRREPLLEAMTRVGERLQLGQASE